MSSTVPAQESSADDRRLLHFTLKITDRLSIPNFFCNILGMKILRHEENDSGCSAQCNGNFESPWSKTMVGYGDEHSHFLFELNYNYDVQGYIYGNDFSSITIRSRQAVANARQSLDPIYIDRNDADQTSMTVRSPDGHRFILIDEDVPAGDDPVQCLSLHVSDLNRSKDYYSRVLKMKISEQESNDSRVRLYYGFRTNPNSAGSKAHTKAGFLVDQQCQLELIGLNHAIERGTGYGRKAFCCPTSDIDLIKASVEKEGFRILIQPVLLGGLLDGNKEKVVILADPDGHEVRFVDAPDGLCSFHSSLCLNEDICHRILLRQALVADSCIPRAHEHPYRKHSYGFLTSP